MELRVKKAAMHDKLHSKQAASNHPSSRLHNFMMETLGPINARCLRSDKNMSLVLQ